MSIEPDASGFLSRVQIGTLADLYWHSLLPNGRIINALEFPEPGDAKNPDIELSSDTVAWDQTKEKPFCKKNMEKPLTDIRWGLAATAGAVTNWHLDTNGFCTYIDVQEGAKWWVVAQERKGGPSFASRDLYNKFNPQDANLDLWEVHAIYLTPGDRL